MRAARLESPVRCNGAPQHTADGHGALKTSMYSAMARARTHGGMAVWIAVRLTLPTTAQPAPAQASAVQIKGTTVDCAVTSVPAAYASVARCRRHSCSTAAADRSAASAPMMAPVPSDPSSRPNPSAPSPSRSRANKGNKAHTPLAAPTKRSVRHNCARITGECRAYCSALCTPSRTRSGGSSCGRVLGDASAVPRRTKIRRNSAQSPNTATVPANSDKRSRDRRAHRACRR